MFLVDLNEMQQDKISIMMIIIKIMVKIMMKIIIIIITMIARA